MVDKKDVIKEVAWLWDELIIYIFAIVTFPFWIREVTYSIAPKKIRNIDTKRKEAKK